MTEWEVSARSGKTTGKVRGRGRTRHVKGQMNGLERRYAEELEAQLRDRRILQWDFEAVRLKIASVENGVDAWYTPDFRIVLPDGWIEYHDTKGHMEPAALLRLKAAADRHPYKFVIVRHSKALGWTYEEV